MASGISNIFYCHDACAHCRALTSPVTTFIEFFHKGSKDESGKAGGGKTTQLLCCAWMQLCVTLTLVPQANCRVVTSLTWLRTLHGDLLHRNSYLLRLHQSWLRSVKKPYSISYDTYDKSKYRMFNIWIQHFYFISIGVTHYTTK